ncbi:hypothetical protein GF367_01590, partial [Candidatus Woesearchaeota archaeon]|nr:hypothetical protein [Candidatus Woesearchaeota archaeon]
MVSLKDLLDKGILIDQELKHKGIDEGLLDRLVEKYGDDLGIIDEDLLATVTKPDAASGVRVVWSYNEEPKKRTYDDFVTSLQKRYRELERILKTRQELLTTTSINRIKQKKEREPVACIGMIIDKTETNNHNYIFTIEDMTSQIKVIITDKKKDVYELAKDLQLDETIGVTGMGGKDIIFADNIILPDIPL